MKKKIVYIAHPISKDVPGNLKKLQKIYRDIALMNDDIIPFIPYYATLMSLQDSSPEERAVGFMHNESIFRSGCIDEVWVYGGEITKGIQIEINWAIELNIPVKIVNF